VENGPDILGATGPDGLSGAFERYKKAIAKVVARIVKPGDIEDIVQETYLRIYRAAQRRPIYHPRSFMLRAARNLALNHVGRADALNHLAIEELNVEVDPTAPSMEAEYQAAMSESPEALVQAEEEFLIFCRAIRELPLQCRRAFLLRKVYGFSQREVARQLGISESTVEKHIAKGLVACSVYMTARGYARAAAISGQSNERRRRP
jgi:RNA polymerase sigma-70 factor (ECF subfamily)